MTDFEKLQEMINNKAWDWTKAEKSALVAGLSSLGRREEAIAFLKEALDVMEDSINFTMGTSNEEVRYCKRAIELEGRINRFLSGKEELVGDRD